MAETLAKYRLDETTDKKEEIKMSLEEAIKIIQVGNTYIFSIHCTMYILHYDTRQFLLI